MRAPGNNTGAGNEGRGSGNRNAEPKPSPRGWSFKKATLTLPIKPTEHVRIVRQFFLCLALIIVIYVLVLYILVFKLDEKLVMSQVWVDASRLAESLAVQWNWALSYGEVYVPEPQIRTNGEAREAEAGSSGESTVQSATTSEEPQEGIKYAPRNHVEVALENAELARAGGKFAFDIVSSLPGSDLAPKDEWSRSALKEISLRKSKRFGEVHKDGEIPHFSYIQGIKADVSCLRCHRGDGFTPGSVVGGFTIDIPITAEFQSIRSSKMAVATLYGGSLGVILFVISLLVLSLSSQLKSAYYHIEQIAREDTLTRLPNRRAFYEFAQIQVSLARRHGWPLCIIMADIDNFKAVNDRFGHKAGDKALTNLSKIIRENIRASDIPCRWGGEEFVIALVNTVEENGAIVAERLRKLFKEMRLEPLDISISCSFGITGLRADETIDEAIARADSTMFEVKREGGDGWKISKNSVPKTPNASPV